MSRMKPTFGYKNIEYIEMIFIFLLLEHLVLWGRYRVILMELI